jgi:hypothetical protein
MYINNEILRTSLLLIILRAWGNIAVVVKMAANVPTMVIIQFLFYANMITKIEKSEIKT